MLVILAAVFVVLNLVDAGLTVAILNLGGTEINPIMRVAHSNLPVFFLLKSFLPIAIVVYLCWKRYRLRVMVAITVGVTTFCVINIVTLLRIQGSLSI